MWKIGCVSMFLALAALACGAPTGPDLVLSLQGDAQSGQALYSDNCAGCHGEDARSGSASTNIAGKGEAELAKTMWQGEGGAMPAFQGSLDEQQMADIIAFVKTL